MNLIQEEKDAYRETAKKTRNLFQEPSNRDHDSRKARKERLKVDHGR